MNVLFIMTDQMRADCMSGVGHPLIQTPTLDRLARHGVLFPNSFVQSAVCGPSRMCFYTGRYIHAHRSIWNEVPLPADEQTIGTYFQKAGYRAALCGKTHHVEDFYFLQEKRPPTELKRIHRSPLRGLEPYEYNDGGLYGTGWLIHLRKQGYDDAVLANPFLLQKPDGSRIAWRFENSHLATVVREKDSDTAFMTDRAMQFIKETGDRPWLLHLSYFRPHQPTTAPAPYHARYDPLQVPPPNRHADELRHAHPLLEPYRFERQGTAFDEELVWRRMRATYYGLITQIDDQLNRLFRFMEEEGLLKQTLILFTSDHGEYLGDHWMFEKELFYDEAYRVPLIIYDPSPEADKTRGTVIESMVQSIDLLPTMLAWAKIPLDHSIQGRSLMPLIRGDSPQDWPQAVYADWDFRFYWTARKLGLKPHQCRGWMIRDQCFKYWHFNALPDVLFDLQKDPQELHNMAENPAYQNVVHTYQEKLLDWRMTYEDNSRAGWTYARRPEFGSNPFQED